MRLLNLFVTIFCCLILCGNISCFPFWRKTSFAKTDSVLNDFKRNIDDCFDTNSKENGFLIISIERDKSSCRQSDKYSNIGANASVVNLFSAVCGNNVQSEHFGELCDYILKLDADNKIFRFVVTSEYCMQEKGSAVYIDEADTNSIINQIKQISHNNQKALLCANLLHYSIINNKDNVDDLVLDMIHRSLTHDEVKTYFGALDKDGDICDLPKYKNIKDKYLQNTKYSNLKDIKFSYNDKRSTFVSFLKNFIKSISNDNEITYLCENATFYIIDGQIKAKYNKSVYFKECDQQIEEGVLV